MFTRQAKEKYPQHTREWDWNSFSDHKCAEWLWVYTASSFLPVSLTPCWPSLQNWLLPCLAFLFPKSLVPYPKPKSAWLGSWYNPSPDSIPGLQLLAGIQLWLDCPPLWTTIPDWISLVIYIPVAQTFSWIGSSQTQHLSEPSPWSQQLGHWAPTGLLANPGAAKALLSVLTWLPPVP